MEYLRKKIFSLLHFSHGNAVKAVKASQSVTIMIIHYAGNIVLSQNAI